MAHPVLLIHGGAGQGSLSEQKRQRIELSLNTILENVYPLLRDGMSALEACTMAAALLEDDPLYNAGKGSKIQSDGKIRMSASLMDGHHRRFAGCVNVEGLKNPIHLARALLSEEDRVLAGQGARRKARELGLKFASPYTERARHAFERQQEGKSGTIGAVALDTKGHLAAATSTGGRGFEFPDRVSDSPTVAGNFANGFAAASATGTGEQIVEFSVAASLCTLVEAGQTLSTAGTHLLQQAKNAQAEFGFISVDAHGRLYAGTTTEILLWGSATRSGYSTLGRQRL
ncbi:MAG: isoaspartyl peptidase/L-asparaginase [Bdellovibrionales bacterium]|nr:isoaspartyl peptidase/L-asparaginase [Bdellovibrionales bacterium]